MEKCIYLILLCFMVLSCHNKTNNGDIVYIYPDGTITNEDYILNNPRWMNGIKFIGEDMEPYKIEKKDFTYIKSCIKKRSCNKYIELTKRKYFRQFIGYKKYSKIYVYINYFAYYKVKIKGLGALGPDTGNTIITSNDGNYAFGHMILDYSSGEIIECEFKK